MRIPTYVTIHIGGWHSLGSIGFKLITLSLTNVAEIHRAITYSKIV